MALFHPHGIFLTDMKDWNILQTGTLMAGIICFNKKFEYPSGSLVVLEFNFLLILSSLAGVNWTVSIFISSATRRSKTGLMPSSCTFTEPKYEFSSSALPASIVTCCPLLFSKIPMSCFLPSL